MGLERADLIARLTARDRVKDLFDALDGDAGDAAVAAAAPAGCDLARPHVVLGAARARPTGRRSPDGSPRACAGATRPASSTRAATRLRAVVLMPDAAAAERVIAQCQAVGAAEGVALGVSAPARDVPETRQALREAARAAQLARTLRPGGGALGYEQLGAYKYLAPPARRRPAARPPLDRGRDAARVRRAAAHGAARHARGVPRPAALGRRDRPRAVHPPEHAAPAARPDRAAHRARRSSPRTCWRSSSR